MPSTGSRYLAAGSYRHGSEEALWARMSGPALASGILAVVLVTGEDLLIAAETPTDAIRTSFEKVVRVLKDPELKKPDQRQERLKRLEQTMGERISFWELSKRSLGPKWKELSEKDRQEFVGLFTRLLRDTYADRIFQYTDEQVEYLSERLEGDYAEVKTNLRGSKVNVPVNYRLMNESGVWRVYDVEVDGVSTVRNYRGQFSKILQTSSYQTLVERLRKKTIHNGLAKAD